MLKGLGKADWRMGEIFPTILENFRFSNLFPVTKDFPEYRFIKCWCWATLLSKTLFYKFTMVQRRDGGLLQGEENVTTDRIRTELKILLC